MDFFFFNESENALWKEARMSETTRIKNTAFDQTF